MRRESAASEALGRSCERESAQWWRRPWVIGVVLAGAVFLAYWPCLNGNFVWDDDAWTLKLQRLFQNIGGLGHIWTDLTALQQYYPLTATTFWLDYHLWGFWSLPYHVENLLLHLAGVGLFWRLLKNLEVPGALLAAGAFALHPMMVESAGWITERKNVLSLVLYLAALLFYGRFTGFWSRRTDSNAAQSVPPSSGRESYVLALLLFSGAELAKATAFSLPAVLLLLCWWKRGRLRWREDVLPTLPFWVISIGLGIVTSWLERTHVGARGPDWDIPFANRCVIAGHALWFYAGKLVWPAHLCFIYPRWAVGKPEMQDWGWPAAALMLPALLWFSREAIGRGPLVAVLFFAGTLFPLLGFFNGYFMRYSFVCDHWAYLPSLGLFALFAACIARVGERVRVPNLQYASAALVLPVLGVLTWNHSAIFTDAQTLYESTLALNPKADLAENNLGLLLAQAGELDAAIPHFEKAVELRPGSAHAHNNLANALRLTGQPRLAVEQYELSLKLEPGNANTCNNLALLLATSSDASIRNGPRAIELALLAREITQGKNPVVLATLAAAFAQTGQFPEAIKTAQEGIRVALQGGNQRLAQAIEGQMELYKNGLSFREP